MPIHLIISADIENQINELNDDEKKELYGNDWFKRNWIGFINTKRLPNI